MLPETYYFFEKFCFCDIITMSTDFIASGFFLIFVIHLQISAIMILFVKPLVVEGGVKKYKIAIFPLVLEVDVKLGVDKLRCVDFENLENQVMEGEEGVIDLVLDDREEGKLSVWTMGRRI